MPRSAVAGRLLQPPLAIVALEEAWAQRDLKVCIRRRAGLSTFAADLVAGLTGVGSGGGIAQ